MKVKRAAVKRKNSDDDHPPYETHPHGVDESLSFAINSQPILVGPISQNRRKKRHQTTPGTDVAAYKRQRGQCRVPSAGVHVTPSKHPNESTTSRNATAPWTVSHDCGSFSTTHPSQFTVALNYSNNMPSTSNIHPAKKTKRRPVQKIRNTLSKRQRSGLPMPPKKLLHILENRAIMEEKNYNRQELLKERETLLPKLNAEQRPIFDDVVNAITNDEQILAFVYGHGGTGKTFLWKSLACVLRSEEKVVLTVASSGIASLLLPSGRTAHSRFKIPLNLHEECTCSIKKNSHLADLLRETDLIIWDEAPMNDRRCFEALDRCLRDVLNNADRVFGGKSILLGGDFRQTLP